MVSQPPPTEVGLVFERLEASSRVAQLEAEIARSRTLWPGGSRSEWRPGCWPSASPSPQSGLVTTVRLSQNGHVKVRGIAQAMINAHCSRLIPAEVEILSAIEMHLPDGVRLIGARGEGQQATANARSDRARHVPARRP